MTERQIQRAVVAYLRHVLPGAIVHHSVNELPYDGIRARNAVIKAKADGMLPGFPDVLILHRGLPYCIEVKREGGRLSEAQLHVRDQMQDQDVPYAVCRSVDEVRAALAEWGVETREVSQNA